MNTNPYLPSQIIYKNSFLTFFIWSFDIVSAIRRPVENFDIRISDFSLLFTFVRNICQSKASNYAKQTQFYEKSGKRKLL